MKGYQQLDDIDTTKTTASSVVPAWLNLKLLATVGFGYMFLMSLASPDNTVSKNQLDFDGRYVQGILLLGLILSFALFVIGRMLPPQKPERTKTNTTTLLEAAAKKQIWNKEDHEVQERVASRLFLSRITFQVTAADNDEKHMINANLRLKNSVSSAEQLLATHKQKITTSDDAKHVIAIVSKKTEIADAVKAHVWKTDQKLAAGRLMKDVSLSNNLNDTDLRIVHNAKVRSALLVSGVNKQMLEDKADNVTIKSALNSASANLPTDLQQLDAKIVPAPMAPLNKAIAIKAKVAEYYWTEPVLMSAGNIAAARAVQQTPDWADVEIVRKADRMTRLVGIKAIYSKETDVETDAWITTIHSDVEKELNAATSQREKLKTAIAEKVKQYVWTSQPNLCYSKARVDAGFGLILGDELAVQWAQERVVALCKKVTVLLAELEQNKKAVPHVINHMEGKFLVDNKDVTFDLIEKADKMLRQESLEEKHEALEKHEEDAFDSGDDEERDLDFVNKAEKEEVANPTDNTLSGWFRKRF